MKKTILLIEDNEQNRYLATFFLESRNYSVKSSHDGPSGIEMAVKNRFDLILLDIQLPGMDGYSVARELRDRVETRDVPIIAVTSYAMAEDREKAIESGCVGYIEKPINPDTFISEIECYMKQEGSHEKGSDC
jgi:two-component system, cell cycle response regulator DivK